MHLLVAGRRFRQFGRGRVGLDRILGDLHGRGDELARGRLRRAMRTSIRRPIPLMKLFSKGCASSSRAS